MICPKCYCEIEKYEQARKDAFEKKYGEYLEQFRSRTQKLALLKGLMSTPIFFLVSIASPLNRFFENIKSFPAFAKWQLMLGLPDNLTFILVSLAALCLFTLLGYAIFSRKPKEEKELWEKFEYNDSAPAA